MRIEGTTLDSVTHPDLVALGRVLRDRMDRTLDAEMEAARAAARRRRSLRDRLLDAEDRSAVLTISTVEGVSHRGVVDAVGLDHVDLIQSDASIAIPLQHITSVTDRG